MKKRGIETIYGDIVLDEGKVSLILDPKTIGNASGGKIQSRFSIFHDYEWQMIGCI
jgi:hypothetical protein